MSAPNSVKRKLNNLASDRASFELIVATVRGEQPRLLSKSGRQGLDDFFWLWNEAGRDLFTPPFVEFFDSGLPFSLENLGKARAWVREHGFDARSMEAARGIDREAVFAVMFITNPLRFKLSDAPCQRTQCGKWFIKKRKFQKTCDKYCGSIARSMAAVKKERAAEHKERLKLTRKALREWRKKDGDWKEFVSRKTELDKRFLTRAVSNKELKPPRGAK